MAEIRVENLHKAFADFVAVKDSTFTVILAGVVGFSIAGKLPEGSSHG